MPKTVRFAADTKDSTPFYLSPWYKQKREQQKQLNLEAKEHQKTLIRGHSKEETFMELQHLCGLYWDKQQFKENYWLHYIVDKVSDYDNVIKVIKEFCDVLDIQCECQSLLSKPHYHLIAISKDGSDPQRKIKNRLYYLRKHYMSEDSKPKGRTYYSRQLKTRVHLVNTVMYIQTKNVKGFADGKLKTSVHFNHCIPYVLLDKQERKMFTVNYLPPSYDEESFEEWEIYVNEKANKEKKD